MSLALVPCPFYPECFHQERELLLATSYKLQATGAMLIAMVIAQKISEGKCGVTCVHGAGHYTSTVQLPMAFSLV